MITWLVVNGIKLIALGFFALGFINLFPSIRESSLVKKLEPFTEPVLRAVRNYLPEGSFDFSYWVTSLALFLFAYIIKLALSILF